VQEEIELIKQAINGDSRSLAELLRQNYSFLYQYLLKITMNKNRAEDLTQETMLRAIEKIDQFESKSKFSTWLITIASRLVIDRARRSYIERRWLEKEQEQTEQFAHNQFLQQQEWQLAIEAIRKLQEHVRIPILLKYYYGYSQDEIAEMINIPVGTVKSRLHSGMKLLRKELIEDEKK